MLIFRLSKLFSLSHWHQHIISGLSCMHRAWDVSVQCQYIIFGLLCLHSPWSLGPEYRAPVLSLWKGPAKSHGHCMRFRTKRCPPGLILGGCCLGRLPEILGLRCHHPRCLPDLHGHASWDSGAPNNHPWRVATFPFSSIRSPGTWPRRSPLICFFPHLCVIDLICSSSTVLVLKIRWVLHSPSVQCNVFCSSRVFLSSLNLHLLNPVCVWVVCALDSALLGSHHSTPLGSPRKCWRVPLWISPFFAHALLLSDLEDKAWAIYQADEDWISSAGSWPILPVRSAPLPQLSSVGSVPQPNSTSSKLEFLGLQLQSLTKACHLPKRN